MKDIPFTGMTKVSKDTVESAAMAIILYIERSRNELFKKAVTKEFKTIRLRLPIFVDFPNLPKSVKYNPLKWFTRIPLIVSLNEVKSQVRRDWTYPHQYFMDNELIIALRMLSLVQEGDVYITPSQGRLITKYHEGDYVV